MSVCHPAVSRMVSEAAKRKWSIELVGAIASGKAEHVVLKNPVTGMHELLAYPKTSRNSGSRMSTLAVGSRDFCKLHQNSLKAAARSHAASSNKSVRVKASKGKKSYVRSKGRKK